MTRRTRRNKSIEASDIYKRGDKYYCISWECRGKSIELKFLQSVCPNCGQKKDWTKPVMVDTKEYLAGLDKH